MKFLKTSIIIIFLLSLLSAGVTFYLSTIRENEKEKRIYLEGVRAELEGHVEKLEGEKTELQDRVSGLEAKNQDLAKQLEAEKETRERAVALVQEKDSDLENLRGQMSDAQKAFEHAQKRNQELERILDELESRMRQVESQKTISTSDANASGFVEVSVVPTNPPATHSSDSLPLPAGSEASAPQTFEKSVSPLSTPVTALPKPPKKRRFLPFLRSSNETKSEVSEEEKTAPQASGVNEKFLTPKLPEQTSVQPMTEAALGKVEPSKPKVEAPKRADQTIAGGNVLVVNRNYNFIVINLGSRQGISLNNILTVQHEGTEIAKVRVEKLYDDYAAAYIVEEQSQHPIGEGDVVTAA